MPFTNISETGKRLIHWCTLGAIRPVTPEAEGSSPFFSATITKRSLGYYPKLLSLLASFA